MTKAVSDSLKGIFAILVLLCHMCSQSGFCMVHDMGIGAMITSFGYWGVSVFLFLSGYGLMKRYIQVGGALSDIYPHSLNTVRIMVMIHKGEVIQLSSVLRMGVGSSCVDNYCNGGIVCGINPDGKLKHFAINKKSEVFYKHPNGAEFNGVEIPGYYEAVEMVKYLAPRFVGCSKLQSWDIAINDDGKPILIECNLSFGGFCLHQMCNGPIFGERTEEMLDYFFQANPYLR